MRTLTVRNAISIALLVAAAGVCERAAGQDTTATAEKQGRAPATHVPAKTPSTESADVDTLAPTKLQTITVTGTRIRGGMTPSPVITIGSEQIKQEGFTDLGEVIRSVPQNFGGGQNPGVAVGATAGAGGIANQNVTGGSSLNLRGLGPDATLTLLNGRRLAYGGIAQAVDISAIPVEAVDRIEIVPDGASAIYGSDAVGGVGNVILKHDYQGVTVGARYGGATDGGLATREYNITAGGRWSTGGLIATYKDVSMDPIYARQRAYTRSMFDPTTLYPGSELRSGLVSLHQSLTDSAELHVDALRTRRTQDVYPYNTGLRPFYYRVTPTTTTSLVSPGLDVFLPGDWTLSVAGTWGRDEHIQRQSRVDLATKASTLLIHDCDCNIARSYELSAEGPLFATPGGDARLAVGLGRRKNTFEQSSYLRGSTVIHGEQSSRFGYAEINLPLVGPASGVSGMHRLDLTAAVRNEDYDSFGGVTTPQLGLIYGPNADVTLKASWGKSFKAPTLVQLHQAQIALLDVASFYGGAAYGPDATVLSLQGGNPDLGPERATTWTVSSAFHPEALPGLQSEITWFDIDYTDRVVPPITDYGRALVNPNDAQFVSLMPSAQAQADLLASTSAFYNFAGVPYDPNRVVAILYARYVNVARQHVKGLDLSSSYRMDVGAGQMTLRGSATWLDSSQKNTPTQDSYPIAGVLFNPAKVRGRLGVVWSRRGWSTSAFANYTSGVTDRANGHKTSSFTTFDATMRYAFGESSGALSGVEVALSAQNLLDRAPPLYVATSPDRPPYDSTNYSAIGGYVSLSVSKHW